MCLCFIRWRFVNISPFHQAVGPPAVGIPRLLIHCSLIYPPYEGSSPFICKPGSGDVVMTGHTDHGLNFRIRRSSWLLRARSWTNGCCKVLEISVLHGVFGMWQRSQLKNMRWEDEWNRTLSFIFVLNDTWIFLTIVDCTGLLYCVF
jgi:hypothetical protein